MKQLQLQQAIEVRGEFLTETVHEVLEFLAKGHEGMNVYEIANSLGWSHGRVDYALKKLKGLIRFELVLEGGRAQKRVYLLKAREAAEKVLGWGEQEWQEVDNAAEKMKKELELTQRSKETKEKPEIFVPLEEV